MDVHSKVNTWSILYQGACKAHPLFHVTPKHAGMEVHPFLVVWALHRVSWDDMGCIAACVFFQVQQHLWDQPTWVVSAGHHHILHIHGV